MIKRFYMKGAFLKCMVLSIFFLAGIKKEGNGQSRLDELMSASLPPFNATGEMTNEFKSYLKKNLAEVRILALGESRHEDGLTFEHKTKLVKYFHEELDFNVIAFEFGFYGNWNTNQNLKQGMDVAQATKYSGWAKSKYGFPVYEYISQTYQTDAPLHYAGFDGEKVPDGIPNIQQFLQKVMDLTEFSINTSDSLILDSLVLAVYGRLGNPYKDQLDYKDRQGAKEILQDLSQRVADQKDQMINQLGERAYMMYKLTLQSILMDEKSTYAGAFWNIVRDKHMAERVFWLADSLYKDEKIILWGASGHFARNMIGIERALEPQDYGYYPYYQMGDWLYEKFGRAYYSIAFTSASGKTGLILPDDHKYKKYEEINNIPSPVDKSFEQIAYSADQSFLFCDLRHAEENTWLKSTFFAYPLGYNCDFAEWYRVFDGFYFIREMLPDEWKE